MSLFNPSSHPSIQSKMLLIILFPYFSPLSAIAPCPLPAEIPASNFPAGWTRQGGLDQWNDGTNDFFKCSGPLFMQLGAGADAFAINTAFRCDPASLKWIVPESGIEAPPFVSCGTTSNTSEKANHCGIYYKQSSGSINPGAIYSNSENICPNSTLTIYGKGTILRYMRCSENEFEMKPDCLIVDTPSFPPNISCAPPFCPVQRLHADGSIKNILLNPGEEQFCSGTEELQWSDGTPVKEITCSIAGLKLQAADGQYVTGNCQTTLKCMPRACPIKNKLPSGAIEDNKLEPGKEQYCPNGEILSFEDGSAINSANCKPSGLEIKLGNGTTVTYSKTTQPTLKCAPPVSCLIYDKPPGGGFRAVRLEPGKEYYCPSGEILSFADGTAINCIDCKSTGLEIKLKNETTVKYSASTAPSLRCAPPVTCPIKNVNSNGAIDTINLEIGKEQYCSSGEVLTYVEGTQINEITCKASGLEIKLENGTTITYSTSTPPSLKCGPPVTCPIKNKLPSGSIEKINLEIGKEQYCPSGEIVSYADGTQINDIKCSVTGIDIELGNGTVVKYTRNMLKLTQPTLQCVPGTCSMHQVCISPTTTTTTTTAIPTTTTRADAPPTSNQLWDVMFYYNYGLILHAFCADQACINVIQNNGIGYDLVNYKGLVGRAIREDAITAVRAACPTGSANLRNLGFTKVGKHYEHNLNGSGLKQGWVAIVYGACGATQPIKRWKCHYSEDMQYETDLEQNTYYKGLVQDGGKVQFWMY